MAKKDDDINCRLKRVVEQLQRENKILEAQLRQLEQTRNDQVNELLSEKATAMSDIAELLTRCVRADNERD